MLRCLLWTIAGAVRPKALLIADNLCLRQQLLVLHRGKPRPRLEDADRRFWVLACRWFVDWQTSVLIVKPDTVWTAQQIVDCCGWDRKPRFLVHDRDSCYAASFDQRVRNLGISQARTPFRSPRANAIAERGVRSVRTEYLDHAFIFNERHLQKVLAEYVDYLNPTSEHPSLYVVEENRFC